MNPPACYSRASRSAAPGNYTLTGESANPLLRAHPARAAQGSYTLTGESANLLFARVLVAARGGYALAIKPRSFALAHKIVAAQGSYALSGEDAIHFEAVCLSQLAATIPLPEKMQICLSRAGSWQVSAITH